MFMCMKYLSIERWILKYHEIDKWIWLAKLLLISHHVPSSLLSKQSNRNQVLCGLILDETQVYQSFLESHGHQTTAMKTGKWSWIWKNVSLNFERDQKMCPVSINILLLYLITNISSSERLYTALINESIFKDY